MNRWIVATYDIRLLTVPELRKLCIELKLPRAGSRSTLLGRLKAYNKEES